METVVHACSRFPLSLMYKLSNAMSVNIFLNIVEFNEYELLKMY